MGFDVVWPSNMWCRLFHPWRIALVLINGIGLWKEGRHDWFSHTMAALSVLHGEQILRAVQFPIYRGVLLNYTGCHVCGSVYSGSWWILESKSWCRCLLEVHPIDLPPRSISLLFLIRLLWPTAETRPFILPNWVGIWRRAQLFDAGYLEDECEVFHFYLGSRNSWRKSSIWGLSAVGNRQNEPSPWSKIRSSLSKSLCWCHGTGFKEGQRVYGADGYTCFGRTCRKDEKIDCLVNIFLASSSQRCWRRTLLLVILPSFYDAATIKWI